MALIEAMAAGCVCVSSDGEGAMESMIEHGVNGYICRLSQWDSDFHSVLSFLGKNTSALRAMKEKSRALYLRSFRVEKTVDHLIELLNSPTVDRSLKPEKIDLIKWHRAKGKSNKAHILDRLFIKIGWLKKKKSRSKLYI